MKPARSLFAAAVAGVAVASTAVAIAQERRAREHDFSIGLAHIDGKNTEFDGGTFVDTDSATGLGFSFDYHLNDRWSVGAEVAMRRIDYVADVAVLGPSVGAPGQVIDGELDSSILLGRVKRSFGNWEKVAPYATIGVGFASIDSNVPEGPPVGFCWWHPWWGFVCDSVQPTHTSTDPMTSLGFGVRWDFGRRLFLDAAVGREWVDFDNASRPDFSTLRVAIGFR